MPHPAFQLDEYVQPEVDLQAAGAEAFDRLLRPPAVWSAFPAGHLALTPQQGARLTRIGLKRGWPDHIIIHGGRVIGIEWKKPGDGKLSVSRMVYSKRGRPRWVPGQKEVFPLLRAAGMHGPYVCSSVDHALRILRALEVPMLWRDDA